jgi:D-arabinose 1-dehydrogenase-like Zn-dependent alcohol dehydrogenase
LKAESAAIVRLSTPEPIQKVNQAYERMLKNDVRYRFVIDLASLQ